MGEVIDLPDGSNLSRGGLRLQGNIPIECCEMRCGNKQKRKIFTIPSTSCASGALMQRWATRNFQGACILERSLMERRTGARYGSSTAVGTSSVLQLAKMVGRPKVRIKSSYNFDLPTTRTNSFLGLANT